MSIEHSPEETVKILRNAEYRFEKVVRGGTPINKRDSKVFIKTGDTWKQVYRTDACGEVTSHVLGWVEDCRGLNHSEVAGFFCEMVLFGAVETEDSFCIIDSFSDG